MLAPRAGRIAVSPTMKVAAEALKLKAQGVDVVDLGAGEPDFPTPAHVSQAAHAATATVARRSGFEADEADTREDRMLEEGA